MGCEATSDKRKKIVSLKGRKIMKRMIKKIAESKKFNKYCVNMLRMYNYGRVNLPAWRTERMRLQPIPSIGSSNEKTV